MKWDIHKGDTKIRNGRNIKIYVINFILFPGSLFGFAILPGCHFDCDTPWYSF